ncbi:MAG: hypothetical protein JXB04_09380, partial [Kiritimatiellae bacterium]|nr:hypothetical protein [Kiritimatiellia bacterium]
MRSLSIRIVTAAVALVVGAGSAAAWDTNNWQFLDTIERANLRFFQEQKRGPYHLLNDTANYDSIYNYPAYASVAGTGFELTAICLGHYRGWISFSNAYEQVLEQLRLFTGNLSTNPAVGERVNGWTFHTYWIEDEGGGTNKAGTRFYMDDGLSMLDHSLFMGGCIFVSEYFKGTEAGDLAHKLYNETTWSWRPNGDYNFGYSENLLAIIESASAPQYAKGTEARTMWNDYINPPSPRNLQLYFWQYPHSWIDFRFRWDGDGVNHANVALDSILYQRQRAIDMHGYDPVKYEMIGSNCWGWTAAGSSEGYRQMAPWGLWLNDQWYDEERMSDSGSITPIGLPGCMIYAGTEAMACMKHIFEQYYVNGWDPSVGERPVWSDVYGWLNCLNKGRPWRYYSDPGVSNHFHGINAGIDYGPNVLLLENYKMGTTWRYFMQNPYIAAGMYTVGFGDVQQITCSTFEGSSNHFGGGLGHWENDATPVTASYADADWTNAYVTGKVVRFVADNSNEGGWIDLDSADMRAKALLTFWAKCHNGNEDIEIGLKDDFGHENKVRLTDVAGGAVPTNWTEVKIPLETFGLTAVLTNDTWLADLAFVSFAFTNAGGGILDVDYLAFTGDTLAPVRPTNAFGCAMVGNHARVGWDPNGAERDAVGYHVWRRLNPTDGFTRVTAQLVPAYRGAWDDTNLTLYGGQQARYAIQALDNAQPANASPFAYELVVEGGRLDVDWNNGCNPNVLGGSGDSYWGGVTTQRFEFVYTNGPNGSARWVRRSFVSSAWSGHYIDLADSDLSDYWALSFWIRGTNGGEQVDIGLRDAADEERKLHLDDFLAGGAVSTSWSRAIIPLADFTNVNIAALRNLSFTHQGASDVYLAEIAFIEGQRSDLMNDYFTEAEDYTRQFGTATRDYKAAASGGEVLGWGWGADGGDYADYEFYLTRPLTDMTVHVRYACDVDTGRLFDVRWNDAKRGSITCTNTGGWGEQTSEFSWATAAIGSGSPAGR